MAATRARLASTAKPTPILSGKDKEERDSGSESEGESNTDIWNQAQKKKKTGKKDATYECKGGQKPCGSTLTDKDESIQCDGCHSWYHPKCQGISPEKFKAIGKYKMFWLCQNCETKFSHLMNLETRIEARIVESENRILQALKSMQSAKSMEGQLGKKLQEMEKNVVEKIQEQHGAVTSALGKQNEVVEATQKTYAEMAQTMQGRKTEHAIVEQLGGKFDEVLKEREDIEKRKLNLVIHGLPETSRDGRKVEDPEAFSALCTELLKIEDVGVESMVRLGPKTPPKGKKTGESANERPWIRPLKVKLKDSISKYKILRAAPELKDIEQLIYITPDKTPKQREEEKNLREQCKKYNAEHRDQDQEAYITRGEMAFREKKRM